MLDKVKPTTSPLQLRCKSCRTVFDGAMTIGPVAVAAAALMALRCPSCGGKQILLGQNRTASEDDRFRQVPIDGPLDVRAQEWRATGERGLSAQSIFAHMTGGDPGDGWQHPHDAGDLHRCMLLLRRIPEWAPRMPEMAKRSACWSTLIGSWPQIVAAFHDEAGPDLANWPRPRTESLIEFALQNP